MYFRKVKDKYGRLHLSITESYRAENGKATNRTVKTFGYLDNLVKKWNMKEEDILDYCKEVCDQMTKKYNESIKSENLEISFNIPVNFRSTNRKNLGSCIILAFYKALGIEKVIRNITYDTPKFSHKKYDINAILRLLVVERQLRASSVLKAWKNKDRYFFRTNFSLDDMYRAYDCFSFNKNRIIKAINNSINKLGIRDSLDTVFYDVTNYYFEVDEQTDKVIDKSNLSIDEKGKVTNTYDDAYFDLDDEKAVETALVKCGHEKTGRRNPIIQMGLLQDKYAIPITYRLFPGNTNDYATMLPILSQLKSDYSLDRIIVVADKGNNTSTNIAACIGKDDGFVFSQSIRGTKSPKELRDWVIDSKGYKYRGKKFKIKSKITTKTVYLKPEDTATGKAETQDIPIKVVAFWSEKYKRRAQAARQKTIAKAYEYINNKGKYETAINYGAAKYVKGINYNKDTGEAIKTDKILEFDDEKLAEEMAADGYYCIITSETKISDDKIINTYRGLWQIEETFKISKSDLSARPVYMRTNSHIRGHFLICYITLTILRVIQHYLHNKYSAKRIISEIKKCCGSLAHKNIWLFDYRTELLDMMYKLIGKKRQMKWMRLTDIKQYFSKTNIPKYYKKEKDIKKV